MLRLILKALVHKVIGAREQTRANHKNGGDNQTDDFRRQRHFLHTYTSSQS
jgi:hypothetical protein